MRKQNYRFPSLDFNPVFTIFFYFSQNFCIKACNREYAAHWGKKNYRVATCSPGEVDGRCLFNFPDREPKFLTVVDASAKVKWVHAKVFVFTKLVYFVALCACSTFQSPFTHSQLAIGYTATACPIMCTCHVCVAITNIQHLQQSQCRVI